MAQLAGGVVIVTTVGEDDRPRGMTATAVCSVSLDPPLVMACVSHVTATYRAVQASGIFALNVLPAGAAALARRFASDRRDKFVGLETRRGATGAPLLAGALAHADCTVDRSVPAGDHTIFIGRVLAVTGPDEEASLPLIYFRGRYGSLAPLAGESAEEPSP